MKRPNLSDSSLVSGFAPYDPWEAISERIHEGAVLVGLEGGLEQLIATPEKVLEVAVPGAARATGRSRYLLDGGFITTPVVALARAGSASMKA